MFNKKEYNKQWAKDNRERMNKWSREWRKNNPEKYKKYNKQRYEERKQYIDELMDDIKQKYFPVEETYNGVPISKIKVGLTD